MNKLKNIFLAGAIVLLFLGGCKDEETFGVEINQTEDHRFPALITGSGYTVTPLSVDVTNVGNQLSGALQIVISGTGAAGFELSERVIPYIEAGETATFTVAPRLNLAQGEYEATVKVSGGPAIIPKTFNVRVVVDGIGIELRDGDSPYQWIGYEFLPAIEGSGYTVMPFTVPVTNVGNIATGALQVALSGDGADAFQLSSTTIASIAAEGTASFTVAPKAALAKGAYNATVTVSGAPGIAEKSLTVKFVVAEKILGIELSQKAAYEFPSVVEGSGYTATPLNITVSNTGNQATGALQAALSGDGAAAFELSTAAIASIAVDGTAEFTVAPKSTLAKGEYNATVTVSGAAGITEKTFNIKFVVEEKIFGIKLSQTEAYEFPSAVEGSGYTATSLKITVSNAGNQATGALQVALSGTGATGFELSSTTIASIAVDGTAEFTVAPKSALAKGAYNATVTVSGSAGITAETFNIRFAVYE